MDLREKKRLLIKNEVDRVHDVYVHFASKFEAVLTPKFDTKSMISKGPRSLGKLNKATLMLMAHGRAHDLLAHRMKLTGGKIIDCYEFDDTGNCSECFGKHHPGIKKIYSCCNPKCKFKGYRDESGWTTLKKTLIRILDAHDQYDKKQSENDLVGEVDEPKDPETPPKAKKAKRIVKKKPPVSVKGKEIYWGSEDESDGEESGEESDQDVVQDANQRNAKMAEAGPVFSVSRRYLE